MAPLDWDMVMAAKPDSLSEDEMVSFSKSLVQYDPTESDAAKLQQLFKVAKAVIMWQADEVEVTMNEMESETKKMKKQEQVLKDEIKTLEKKVDDFEKFGADKGPGTSRKIREEYLELEKENENLKQDLKDLRQDLNSERGTAEKYSQRISVLENDLKEMREDNERLQAENSDYRGQLLFQRKSRVAKTEDTETLQKKLKEIGELLEENQNLTDANNELNKRFDELKQQYEEAILQMDRTTEDYAKLKIVLQQSDAVTDRLREDNEILKAKVADLNEQVQSKTDADDAIMVAVDNKIEEWKLILQDKDQTILDQQDQIFRLREQIIAMNMDSDKSSVAAMSRIVKEKDKQIEELSEQLKVYADDLDNNAAIIEDLRAEIQKSGKGPGDRQQQRIRELQDELKYQKERTKEFEKDAKQAESDASAKDKDLAEALERMRQYESGEYGLAEAVAEIKDCKTQIRVRDRQIEELTQHINKTEMTINDLCEENEDLRGRLGLDPRKPLDLTEFRSKKAVRKEEEKALNYILQKEVERLEEERLELKQKIRKLAQHTGQRAVALGLTAEDMMAVQEFTEGLKTKKQPESVAEVIKREVAMEESQIKRVALDQDYRENLREIDRLFADNAQMKAKVEQLEEENKSLEAGLKEVMEAMRKYGATEGEGMEKGEKEAMVMQFPTLERMLAAIEAKSVIGRHDTSLFLKAQMDNLQGRNDELRAALREIRHESNKSMLERDKALEK